MSSKISYISFIFFSFFAYSQVTLAVSPVKDSKVNQQFRLTVLLEISGENMQQETPLRMPDLSKFEIIGSASEQNTVVIDAKKGDIVNQMVYQWVLSPKQTGKIKFGSILVTVNGKIYKTEPFDINVSENETEKKSAFSDYADNNDVYLNLEIQNKVVYKNEPTVAVLRVFGKDYENFRRVNDIQFSPQKNINIKPLSFAKSEIEYDSGMNSQVIAVFLVFPSETGDIEINPVSAKINNSVKEDVISSNRVKLNVIKLPEGMPETFKNAVGKFELSVINKGFDEILEIEKPINFMIKISGIGNFGAFNFPKLVKSDDYVFFEPKITQEIQTKKEGLYGNITAEYVVIPKKTGNISINLEGFSYFDPDLKKYIEIEQKSATINVKTHKEIADAKTTLEKVNDYTNTVLKTVSTPILKVKILKIEDDKNKINWKIILMNAAFFAALIYLILFLLKRRRKPILNIEKKNYQSITETENIIKRDFGNQYNESIEYLKKLKENGEFDKFFYGYEELKEEIKNRYFILTEIDFKKFIERTKGEGLTEKYRILSEQIQIEKFSPIHSKEQIDEIFNNIIDVFLEINR